jgi:hypothetical protein
MPLRYGEGLSRTLYSPLQFVERAGGEVSILLYILRLDVHADEM